MLTFTFPAPGGADPTSHQADNRQAGHSWPWGFFGISPTSPSWFIQISTARRSLNRSKLNKEVRKLKVLREEEKEKHIPAVPVFLISSLYNPFDSLIGILRCVSFGTNSCRSPLFPDILLFSVYN